MGEVIIRGHKINYIDAIHIDPRVFQSNPAVGMVATPGLAVIGLLGAFVGAAVYHSFSFKGPIAELPPLSFSHLSNFGGKIGALIAVSLITQGAVAEFGAHKITSALYDSAVFSIEAWPQVLFYEAIDFIGESSSVDIFNH